MERGVDLGERVCYSKKQFPEQTIHAACATEIELDVLTGQVTVTRVDILQDVGMSINPQSDVMEIQRAFTRSMGYWLTENLVTDEESGEVISDGGKWNGPIDLLTDFRVHLWESKEMQKPVGNYSSALTWSIQPAVRYALNAARKDAGEEESFLQLDTPCYAANILLLTGNNSTKMGFKGLDEE